MAIVQMTQKKQDIFQVERFPQCFDQSTRNYAQKITTRQEDTFHTVTIGGVMVQVICCLSELDITEPLKNGQGNNKKRVGKPTLNQ